VQLGNTGNVALRNIGVRSLNYSDGGKAIYIKNSDGVPVALVKRHAEHMCRIVLSSVG
jgi:hypothetical protein